jgi:UDPglucose--hexose-1-phosphate uridylyltransferase
MLSLVRQILISPGNTRVGGQTNPKYQGTFVFDNDFPAVKEEQPLYNSSMSLKPEAAEETQIKLGRLFKVQGVRGCAKVICFSENHNLTMAEMNSGQIELIIERWKSEIIDLKSTADLKYVQIFENKGSSMGCSNPHPHGQIWATDIVPQEPAKELASLTKYRNENNCCLLCDLVATEQSVKDRIVCENNNWICIVPFWAVWPFETMILSKLHISSLESISINQQKDLADLLQKVTCKYDNIFNTSFPYSMGIHGEPFGDDSGIMHLHLHFYPPLLRSATVKKFLVGYDFN